MGERRVSRYRYDCWDRMNPSKLDGSLERYNMIDKKKIDIYLDM
jgi:hypothetical protein